MSLSRALRLIPVALLFIGCGGSPSDPSAEPSSFRSTVSFGFCLPASYCSSRLDVSSDLAILTYESHERAAVVRRRSLEPSEWRQLVSALDATRLRALPSVVGCPDCADGGSESLSVMFADGRATTVTFENNHDVPGIEAVVSALRNMRQTFGTAP